jgi:N-sulfoglucosamine sulfohydrolase
MRWGIVSLWVVMAVGPAVPAGAAARNIVLVVSDDHGQDAGCYGNPVIKTPHLDRLAADGTRFRYAFATTASCSASRSVLLTGLHNHANGHYGHEHAYHHFSSLPQVKSLPVLLHRAGYRTARIGKFHVAPEEVYRFDRALPGNSRSPVEMADSCKDFIAAGDQPFFLYFCTADPHRGGGKAGELPEKPDRFGNKPGDQPYPGIKPVTYDPKQVVVPPFLPDTPACRAELAQYYQAVARLDQGLGRLIQVLQETGKYDQTLILFLSDHGVPFPGAKTTVYDPGLLCPCVVRHPDQKQRGVVSRAMISWVDIAPTLLDVAGALDPKTGAVRPEIAAAEPRGKDPAQPIRFHGRSFLSILDREDPQGWDEIYASHTFHEVTMYYPMKVVRTRQYKLIWNLAHPLPFPFASDLWESSTWQEVHRRGLDARYGQRSVRNYIQRPRFELYDLTADPHEVKNLADDPRHAMVLEELKNKLKEFQKRTQDPWISKWEYE